MSRTIAMLFFVVLFAMSCGGTGETPHEADRGAPDAPGAALDAGADEDEAEELEIPPADAKPLSEIVLMLEDVGYVPILEIEFENGVWEVEALHYGGLVEIAIDPVTGEPIEDFADGA